MRSVLVASDKFKGSLTAVAVGDALATGLLDGRPNIRCQNVPVADGGDGTVAAAVAAGYETVPVRATGPTGEVVSTSFARRGSRAVIELADACGLSRLPGGRFSPLTASSRGVGDVVRAALDAGCDELVLGVGGSASTDGGAGLLAALGVRWLNRRGDELPPGGAALADLHHFDLSGLHPAITRVDVTIACDVANPLTGPTGAAAVYGPQKGATGDDTIRLDAGLTKLADVVSGFAGRDLREVPGVGAAGGVAFGAAALLGASLASGIDLMLDLVGFPTALASADLVITGEGSLDAQTLSGKAAIGVATAAGRAGVRTIAVCGRNLLSPSQSQAAGFAAVYALSGPEADPGIAMREAARLLTQLGRSVAHEEFGPPPR